MIHFKGKIYEPGAVVPTVFPTPAAASGGTYPATWTASEHDHAAFHGGNPNNGDRFVRNGRRKLRRGVLRGIAGSFPAPRERLRRKV